ncbi:MAG: cation:proton antiporter [Chloroflexi bacterium]|nr:cation:proton antiporter [Chloroflexota bacterium]
MTLDDFALYVVLPILTLAVCGAFVRLVRGPSLPDRVVALDLMTTLGIGIIASHAIATGQAAFLDVAIAMALISFLGTVAFAYYIERRV